jgi:hypothetical protein
LARRQTHHLLDNRLDVAIDLVGAQLIGAAARVVWLLVTYAYLADDALEEFLAWRQRGSDRGVALLSVPFSAYVGDIVLNRCRLKTVGNRPCRDVHDRPREVGPTSTPTCEI